MKLRSQAFQGTKPAARAVGIPGIHAGEDVKFIGWLMWSSKADKEVFLFYAWASMIVIGALGWIYESNFGPIT